MTLLIPTKLDVTPGKQVISIPVVPTFQLPIAYVLKLSAPQAGICILNVRNPPALSVLPGIRDIGAADAKSLMPILNSVAARA